MYGRQRGPALRFRVFGTPVRIGLGFPITIVGVPLLLFGEHGRDPWFLSAWLLLVTVSVLVHEAGHVTALRAYGFSPAVSLNVFGGLTTTANPGRLPAFRSILVSLAGPAAGIAFGFTIESALIPIAGQQVEWLRAASWMVNIWWSVVNLLPIMPLDGGHVVGELVEAASRRRGATIAWLIVGILAVYGGVWALLGTSYTPWVLLVFALMVLTNVRSFAFTSRQRKQQDITIAHEQLMEGDIRGGVDTLLPVALSADTAMIPDSAYTTLAWALLHERRFHELSLLDPTRFHPHHRPLLDGATAWYRGDVSGAMMLVSDALSDGWVTPPDGYFARVFGRLGELDRLAHHIAGLPVDASNVAATRLRTGLASAQSAA